MKALTVQQPWAWAIFHGKDVENRTQAWTYRGPLAIHAGKRWSDRGARVVAAHTEDDLPDAVRFAAIVGVVDLVDVHHAVPEVCCDSPWAEWAYVEHGGRVRRQIVHLVLENPRELDEPIPCRGALGLWTPPADVLALLEAAIA